VAQLVERIERENIGVLLAANYFEKRKPELIADRTGIVPVVMPTSVEGEAGVETYFDLIDTWIGRLRAAFEEADSSERGKGGRGHGKHHAHRNRGNHSAGDR
jgi:hypothetical protein